MPKLLTVFASLARRDSKVLNYARGLSALLIAFGVGWLFLLPLDDYNRHTYVSENALLPGQVHTYFGGSEHTVFRAYRHEVNSFAASSAPDAAAAIEGIFKTQGLKTARQSYNFTYAGRSEAGENAYALLQGPRADATEAMVLMASLHNMDGQINYSGVALVLTMARYFKRWSLWSKDILFVITTDSAAGPQAWVSAYHDQHDPITTAPLPLKAGAIQAAIAVDYPASPAGHRFDKLHVLYDGVNGAQPNLDLLNTLITVASNQVGIQSSIQGMHQHTDSYNDRLYTILRGIISQGAGKATGPHSAFMPFHVDAVTLQTVGDGWHDEISFGMVIESGIRSINNLLEKLHQSFFFYLLLGSERFVSIGTYLPSAMLIAGSFSVTSVALWMQSGKPVSDEPKPSDPVLRSKNRERARSRAQSIAKGEKPVEEMETLRYMGNVTVVPVELLQAEERSVGLPIAVVGVVHLLGLVPLYLLNNATEQTLLPTLTLTTLFTFALPVLTILILTRLLNSNIQQQTLISCFSLLILGISLATLSTLNFSLGLLIGLCAAPLNFASPLLASPSTPVSKNSDNTNRNPGWKHHLATAAMLFSLTATAPPTILAGVGAALSKNNEVIPFEGVKRLLIDASFAWHVNGTWTSVVVWLVWWPAWVMGASVVVGRLVGDGRPVPKRGDTASASGGASS